MAGRRADSANSTIERIDTNIAPAVEFLSYIQSPLYTRRYFEWKIARNPFGGAACYIRLGGGARAAHCSITAKPVNAELLPEVSLAELGDTHTHPGFQRQGHFASLGKHVIEDFESRIGGQRALIYGLPNDQALPGWTRSIGCKVLQDLGILDMYRMPWRSFHPRTLVAGMTEQLSGVRLEGGQTAELCRNVDEIWSKCDRSAWLIAKDARWWEWRYHDAPQDYITYLLRERGGAARAWVAVKISRTRYPGVRRVALCDIVGITREDERNAFVATMRQVTRWRDLVHGWFQMRDDALLPLRQFGFVVGGRISVIAAANEGLAELEKRGGWFRLSLGDGDNV
jgi:hypothetical protein